MNIITSVAAVQVQNTGTDTGLKKFALYRYRYRPEKFSLYRYRSDAGQKFFVGTKGPVQIK